MCLNYLAKTPAIMLINECCRLIGNHLSPAGKSARLNILIYHRVLAEQDAIFPHESTTATFDAQLSLLKSVFNVLPLAEAVARLKTGMLPERAVCISFDDGYADNVTQALPILQKHGLHATFFIATAYLNGGRMFNDTVIEAVRRSRGNEIDLGQFGLGRCNLSSPKAKREVILSILPKVKYLPLNERESVVAELTRLICDTPLPDDLMMTTKQLKELHASGMGIGGHTSRHSILAKLDDSAVFKEIAEGKEFLEATLKDKISLFAYPNGKPGADYLPEQASIVRKLGFSAALSTQQGSATASSDIFQLPRFTPWHQTPSRFALGILGNMRRSIGLQV